MNRYERMRAVSVVVNSGSGVIVQPMSNEYSYILTAKHNLETKPIKIHDYNWNDIEVQAVYEHPTKDCAIIVIPLIPNIVSKRYQSTTYHHNASMMIVGFPHMRRTAEHIFDRYKNINGQMTSVSEETIVFTPLVSEEIESVEGISGGGLYFLVDPDHAYLIGIETRMDGANEPGSLRGLELKLFDKIVLDNGLAPIVPSFLECFSNVHSDTFNFDVIDETNTNRLRSELHLVAEELVQTGIPSPLLLLQKYQTDLLLKNENQENLYEAGLWVAYFEFLIICALIDKVDKIDLAYINQIEHQKRFIYSMKSDNWLRYYMDIINSAEKLLDENGLIVISTKNNNGHATAPEAVLEHLAENIAQPRSRLSQNIDSGIEPLLTKYRVRHLTGLHNKCVTLKEYEYARVITRELIDFFRNEYNAIIK